MGGVGVIRIWALIRTLVDRVPLNQDRGRRTEAGEVLGPHINVIYVVNGVRQ